LKQKKKRGKRYFLKIMVLKFKGGKKSASGILTRKFPKNLGKPKKKQQGNNSEISFPHIGGHKPEGTERSSEIAECSKFRPGRRRVKGPRQSRT